MEDELFKNLDKLNDLRNTWNDALTGQKVLANTLWTLFENNEPFANELIKDLNSVMNKASAQLKILKENIEKEKE